MMMEGSLPFDGDKQAEACIPAITATVRTRLSAAHRRGALQRLWHFHLKEGVRTLQCWIASKHAVVTCRWMCTMAQQTS